ncbi:MULTISPECIES: phosphonate metabolism transcriptional regulator PhnF [unclassified Mesorhizobium]|uniref:phosphonate metabolism transcriptional regulator PhnF n=1 Tax=unclassified Mesorhizobium TaxID=325217 RepID=UPI0006F4E806|nr:MULTISPECIES: phosphonate metabolism transcriptional regulator PhnF [unclassified Mesorhizobium]KQZ15589.1 phosphonate metabolism transcriptional regulator PhnF [Mesorhizobium sp. Root1471]KQZ38097.1 phosphonate metabolism transcriptional regulator PhnF [Mesorhizobium sp. Root554]MDR7033211.1 GntR family phosphonate transport system transcriptional regulator [Mesorhizobium sp. BE184]
MTGAGTTGKRRAIQRGVGVALWRQIADDIRGGLAAGTLAGAEGRLPPEAALAERFGVNRHTVRAAIAALAHEGVLHPVHGRGTFARRQKRLVYPIGERTRFSTGLGSQARERHTDIFAGVQESASTEIAKALGLEAGSKVIRVEARGSADGVPVSRATSWFDAQRFPTIAEAYADAGSLSAALRKFGVEDYLRASTRIEARHADEADARDLRLSPGAVVIVTHAINVDMKGDPFQYSRTRFPADRVELVVESQGKTTVD